MNNGLACLGEKIFGGVGQSGDECRPRVLKKGTEAFYLFIYAGSRCLSTKKEFANTRQQIKQQDQQPQPACDIRDGEPADQPPFVHQPDRNDRDQDQGGRPGPVMLAPNE